MSYTAEKEIGRSGGFLRPKDREKENCGEDEEEHPEANVVCAQTDHEAQISEKEQTQNFNLPPHQSSAPFFGFALFRRRRRRPGQAEIRSELRTVKSAHRFVAPLQPAPLAPGAHRAFADTG
ncbi:MAG: hypothetical protein V3V62_02495 [bacterium]